MRGDELMALVLNIDYGFEVAPYNDDHCRMTLASGLMCEYAAPFWIARIDGTRSSICFRHLIVRASIMTAARGGTELFRWR